MKHLQVRIDDEMHARLDQLKRERGYGSLQAVTREALSTWASGSAKELPAERTQAEQRFASLAVEFYRVFRGKSIMHLVERTMQQELRAAMAAMEIS